MIISPARPCQLSRAPRTPLPACTTWALIPARALSRNNRLQESSSVRGNPLQQTPQKGSQSLRQSRSCVVTSSALPACISLQVTALRIADDSIFYISPSYSKRVICLTIQHQRGQTRQEDSSSGIHEMLPSSVEKAHL